MSDMDEAVSLATALWRRHYREEAPQWEPLDTVAGVISQIDNMTAGMIQDIEDLTAERDALKAQWVSVDDELPLDGDIVLVHGGCAHHESAGWYSHMDLGRPSPIQWEVAHWMPLPEAIHEPPLEKSDGC